MPVAEMSVQGATCGASTELAWAEFGRRLRAFVVQKGLATGDAEDLVQEVLLKGFQHRSSVQRGRLNAWLYTTARRAIVDRRRALARRARRFAETLEIEELPVTPEPDANALRELASCLQPLLAEIEPHDRAILQRVEIDGAPQVELASELGLPLSTLKSRVQRARRRLRERYERCCALQLDGRGVPLGCAPRGGGCS